VKSLLSSDPALDVTDEDTEANKTCENCDNQRKVINKNRRYVSRETGENSCDRGCTHGDYLRPTQRFTYRTRIPRPIKPARIATTRGRFVVRISEMLVVSVPKIVAIFPVVISVKHLKIFL